MKLLLYKDAKKKYVVRYNKKCYSFIDIEDCLSFALSEGEYLTDVDDFYIDYIKKITIEYNTRVDTKNFVFIN